MYDNCPKGLRITDLWWEDSHARDRAVGPNPDLKCLVRVEGVVYVYKSLPEAAKHLGLPVHTLADQSKRDKKRPVARRKVWFHRLMAQGPLPKEYVRRDT